MPAPAARAAADPPFVGVDVGGTKIAAAALGERGPVAPTERPTDRSSTEAVLAGIEAAVSDVARAVGGVRAVGVGMPSQIDHASGAVRSSVNIPVAGVPLREELRRRLGVPVVVENDGSCAAVAEAHAGEGPPPAVLVMLTLGTGVGGGIVVHGAPFRGASGLGGELGHLVVDADGPDCPGNCPNRGCLEALCSGPALERDATALAANSPDSPLGRALAAQGRVSGREAVAAARAGDRGALALFRRMSGFLGAGMSGLINAFEPEVIAVGGGLSAAGDLFLEQARAEALARALPALAARVSIVPARTGAAAGVLGAALIAAGEYDGAAGDTATAMPGTGR